MRRHLDLIRPGRSDRRRRGCGRRRARPPGIVRAGLLWDWPALMSRYPQIAPWTIDRLTPAELDVLLLSVGRW